MIAIALGGERITIEGPPELDRALETRGFAREVQMVLARAREKGMESDDLVTLGTQGALHQVPRCRVVLGQKDADHSLLSNYLNPERRAYSRSA